MAQNAPPSRSDGSKPNAVDFVAKPVGVELRHLRYFLLVAEELHFGRAAARAGIDSSPLSRQIVDLEERLGIQLFARDRRHTELTAAGRMFVDDVRRIFTDIDTSIERLRIAASGEGIPLRIGLAEGAAGPEFGRFIQLARQAEPPIQITLVEKPAVKLFALLARGGLDAAFTLSGPDGDAELEAEAVWRGRLCVVIAPDHWAASRKGISLAEMRDEAWIMPDREAIPGYAEQIDRLLQRHQITPSVLTIAAHQNSITQFAAAGVGVGLVAEGITRGADGAVMLPLTDKDAILEGWFIRRRNDSSHILSRVRELVQQVGQHPEQFQRPLP